MLSFSRKLFPAAASLAAISVFIGSVSAQQQVCVVDIAEIFRNHTGFNQQIESLKQAAEQYKTDLERRGNELRARSEKLRDYQIGSAEYKQLEAELAQASANLDVERRAKTRDFVQFEAKLHFDTYVEVTRAIAETCEKRGYRLAIRYDGSKTDATRPEAIMQRVNENVIFHMPQYDITGEIVSLLAASAPRTGAVEPSSQRKLP